MFQLFFPPEARSEAGLSWHPAFLVYPPARIYGAPVQSSPVPIDVWVATVHIRRTMPSVCGDENSYFFPASSRYYITPYMYSCSCSWSYLPTWLLCSYKVCVRKPPPPKASLTHKYHIIQTAPRCTAHVSHFEYHTRSHTAGAAGAPLGGAWLVME